MEIKIKMITEEFKLPSSVTAEKSDFDNTAPQNDIAPGETTRDKNPKTTFTKKPLFTLGVIFFLIISGAFSVYLLQPKFEQINLSRMNIRWGMILLFGGSFLLLSRLGVWSYLAKRLLHYTPVISVKDEGFPSCTVIVPAFNEGKQVYSTLLGLTNSWYPAEKLQLIAIDDGSKDNTWDWMKKAKEQLGDRVSIYQQPSNQGKRYAIYRGLKMATGDVFVTVDGNSVVDKDTLRNLVQHSLMIEIVVRWQEIYVFYSCL